MRFDSLYHGFPGIVVVRVSPRAIASVFVHHALKLTVNFLTTAVVEGSSCRNEKLVEFCRDADVLILDAQYTPEDIKTKKGWGHSSFVQGLEFAKAAGVGCLVMYHYDPVRTDPEIDEIYKRALAWTRDQGAPKQVVASAGGLDRCLTEIEIRRMIAEMGYEPRRRDTLYHLLPDPTHSVLDCVR